MLKEVRNNLTLNPGGNNSEKVQGNSAFAQLLADQVLLKERVEEAIIFSKPIISAQDKGVIYPYTINIIQGKKGSHKSRLVEGIVTCLLKPEKENYLGLSRDHDDQGEHFVLYIDTERNVKDQFPFALQNIARKSGFKNPNEIPNFDFISLVNTDRNERFNVIEKYIDHAKKAIDQHLIIVLDVMTDCIDNFNDAKNSMKLIDLMNKSINQEEVTYICVIHENPGSEKARGHLGTEAGNKASTQIQISIEKHGDGEELIKIKYLKTRRSRRPEDVFAVFNEETKDLELAGEDLIKKKQQNNQRKAPLEKVMIEMEEILNFKRSRTELIETLMNKFNCSKNTIVERIDHIEKEKLTFNDFNRDSRLVKIKEGKEVFYLLEAIVEKSDDMQKEEDSNDD